MTTALVADRVDIVCPVVARDLDRFRLLVATRQQFWRVPGRFVAAVRAEERETFRSFEDAGVELITQQDLTGPVPFAKPPLKGWYQQQMVKLAFSGATSGACYIAIDADVFFAQPMSSVEDLFPDGKLPYATVASRDAGFYAAAAAVLGIDTPTPAEHWAWRPPFALDTALVREILACIEAAHHAPWQSVCKRAARHRPVFDAIYERFFGRKARPYYWTEMLLYQLGVTRFGRQARHVRRAWTWAGTLPFGTAREDHLSAVELWDPAETFCRGYTFGVVQGFAGVPASRVRDKIAPYLTSPDAAATAARVTRG